MENSNQTGFSQVPLFTTLNQSRKVLRLFLLSSLLLFIITLVFVLNQ